MRRPWRKRFDVYLTDAGYQPEEEIEEQDAIDALLTWKQTRSSIAQTKLSRGFGNQGQLKKLAARVKCFKCRQVGHFFARLSQKRHRRQQGLDQRWQPPASGRHEGELCLHGMESTRHPEYPDRVSLDRG